MKEIMIPAVIAKTQEELDDILFKIKDSAQLLQLDIMDGKFVPNHSLDFDFRLPAGKYKFEAHLMVQEPEKWMEENWEKVDVIIAHFEAVGSPTEIIESVKSRGKKIAFALNPETEVDQIRDYLNDIDQVLIMTVHPGFYGSKFLPETMGKIGMLRKLRPELDIEVDGGIKPDTIAQAYNAGANMFVSGSYLIRSDDIKGRIDILKSKINTLPNEEDRE
ncbi:MAG: ribulose-phosphate 3-epimerase [Candidatus Aminicenantes bacterium]|nr:MAG: ribulose-phosphate 3-epimerase [Candidatus Aminicenantes bacterium]